ncbi:hypothetical protein Slu03_01270 [Sediminihabitans luteus]|nr:SRPBCC domain-containing protein [Sediminihabitans luteus]GII97749.1 hypothetical protein Slu03_01270 [Sediminihabitans luteus]
MPLSSWNRHGSTLTIVWGVTHDRDRAWRGLTDPSLVPRWLGEPLGWDLAVGGRVDVDHGSGAVSRSEVLRLEPPALLEMTWDFPDEPRSRVRVDLVHDDPARTCLTLEHVALRDDLVDDYRAGWMTHLSYFEAALDGTSLPRQQFWNLHASFAALSRPH